MRVLVVLGFPFPHVGGVSSYVQTLRAALSSRRLDVDVVSVSDIPSWRKNLSRIRSGLIRPFGRAHAWEVLNKARIRLLAAAISERMGAVRYDVVNAHDVWSMNAVLDTEPTCQVPKVLTVHGYAAHESAAYARTDEERRFRVQVMMDLERKAYQGADTIVAVDSRIADHVLDLTEGRARVSRLLNRPSEAFFGDVKRNRSEVRGKYGISEDSWVILCPRRLVPKNGVAHSVVAMKYILQEVPNAWLLVAGDGEEKSQLQRLAREHGVADRVLFIGAVDAENMPFMFGASDCVVIPSVTYLNVQEATSIAALEGMAAGVPVVASAIGGLREIIRDRETGILVPEADPAALASAVIELNRSPVLVSAVVTAASEFVRRHSHSWVEGYISALQARRANAENQP